MRGPAIMGLALAPLLSACVGTKAEAPQAAMSEGVPPGIASCLTAIGRPDVVADPEAPMSNAEIVGLVGCTADRAKGT